MNRAARRREGRLQRKAAGKPWVPLQRAEPVPLTEHQIAEHFDYGRKHGYSDEQIRAIIADPQGEVWRNDEYQVAVLHLKGADEADAVPMVQLSIRRIDRKAVHDWRDLQRVKNQLVGSECEAVELYPAESRLVDTANQYFLFAVLDPSFRFPWGFQQRLVSDESTGGARQRPFDEEPNHDGQAGVDRAMSLSEAPLHRGDGR